MGLGAMGPGAMEPGAMGLPPAKRRCLATGEEEDIKAAEAGEPKLLVSDLPLRHTHLVNAVFSAAEALDLYNVAN